MWTIIKFDRKKLDFLKRDFRKKLGEDVIIYSPIISIQRYKKNKLIIKELSLLGDYIFCFHKKFENPNATSSLKFTKGLKYFLDGFIQSQEEIKYFIKKCKNSENEQGYLTQKFFKIYIESSYKFASGPFAEKIFKIINLQKNKINILLGNIKTTIRKEEFLFHTV